MDNIKEYIKLHRKFKTDQEIADETGITLEEIQKIGREIDNERWMERTLRSKKRTGRF